MEDHTSIFPFKEQSVVLNTTENLELMDYVKAIGNTVTPKNVLFASKISKQRICIYLSATSWVDEVVSNHSSVTLKTKSWSCTV